MERSLAAMERILAEPRLSARDESCRAVRRGLKPRTLAAAATRRARSCPPVEQAARYPHAAQPRIALRGAAQQCACGVRDPPLLNAPLYEDESRQQCDDDSILDQMLAAARFARAVQHAADSHSIAAQGLARLLSLCADACRWLDSLLEPYIPYDTVHRRITALDAQQFLRYAEAAAAADADAAAGSGGRDGGGGAAAEARGAAPLAQQALRMWPARLQAWSRQGRLAEQDWRELDDWLLALRGAGRRLRAAQQLSLALLLARLLSSVLTGALERLRGSVVAQLAAGGQQAQATVLPALHCYALAGNSEGLAAVLGALQQQQLQPCVADGLLQAFIAAQQSGARWRSGAEPLTGTRAANAARFAGALAPRVRELTAAQQRQAVLQFTAPAAAALCEEAAGVRALLDGVADAAAEACEGDVALTQACQLLACYGGSFYFSPAVGWLCARVEAALMARREGEAAAAPGAAAAEAARWTQGLQAFAAVRYRPTAAFCARLDVLAAAAAPALSVRAVAELLAAAAYTRYRPATAVLDALASRILACLLARAEAATAAARATQPSHQQQQQQQAGAPAGVPPGHAPRLSPVAATIDAGNRVVTTNGGGGGGAAHTQLEHVQPEDVCSALWHLSTLWGLRHAYFRQVWSLLDAHCVLHSLPAAMLHATGAAVGLQAASDAPLPELSTGAGGTLSSGSCWAAAMSEFRQLAQADDGRSAAARRLLLTLLTSQGLGLMPDAHNLPRWSTFQYELQAAVAAAVGELSFQLSRVTVAGTHVPLPVGVVLTNHGGRRVAVFADGPGCFLSNARGVRVAPVAMRDEMLQLDGWAVVSVQYYDWPPDGPGQKELVSRLLEKVA